MYRLVVYMVSGWPRQIHGEDTLHRIENDAPVPAGVGAEYPTIEDAKMIAGDHYAGLSSFYRFDIVDSAGVTVEHCHPRGGVWTWIRSINGAS
jgi:hypothetical protein